MRMSRSKKEKVESQIPSYKVIRNKTKIKVDKYYENYSKPTNKRI